MQIARNVVVGFDDSEFAHEALRVAAALSDAETRITVVHAYWIPPEIRYYEFFEDLETEMEKAGRDLLGAAREILAGCEAQVEYVARRGRPADVLADVAVECAADQIVVGSRGHGRMSLGSVTYRLLAGAPCSVLVVSPPATGKTPQLERILVAIDGSPDSEAAATAAVDLATRLGAAMTFAVVAPFVAELIPALPGQPGGYVGMRDEIEADG